VLTARPAEAFADEARVVLFEGEPPNRRNSLATSGASVVRAGRCSRQKACEQNVIELSICRKPLLFAGWAQPEAFIAVRRDFITFLLVRADATDIGHEDTRFPGDVGPHIP
jgi:hypothetical protein